MEVDYKIVSMRNIMIVTGASSGMGSCFAKFLCEEYMADKKNKRNMIPVVLMLVAALITSVLSYFLNFFYYLP